MKSFARDIKLNTLKDNIFKLSQVDRENLLFRIKKTTGIKMDQEYVSRKNMVLVQFKLSDMNDEEFKKINDYVDMVLNRQRNI